MSKLIYLKKQETLRELIGRFVYLSYTPSRCGVIIETWMSDSGKQSFKFKGNEETVIVKPSIFCNVEWLKTTKTYPDKITEHRLNSLKDFDELIKEHQTKYLKHKKTLGELQILKLYKRYGVWILRKSKTNSFDVIHLEKFTNYPSKKEIKKLQKQYPGDIVEVCPRHLVEIYKTRK